MKTELDNSVIPMLASLKTRIIYSLALVSFLVSALAGSTGWVSLALGGGVMGIFGPTAFAVIAGFVAFRAYQVLRYPATLDARPPNTLGWILRWLGWICMCLGAISTLSLFVVKPITTLLFSSAGDSGIGFFVVGMALVVFANFGWLGCIVFEVSRVCGRALTDNATSSWSLRKQDFAVLSALVIAAISIPYLFREMISHNCGENNLAACSSTTHSEIRRVIGLPYGEPVVLKSNVAEIEMRSTSGRKWSMFETPQNSLLGAGHPAAESAPSEVRVNVDAKLDGQAVILELIFFQGTEETARFVTRFSKGATLEKTSEGRKRIVVDLPANSSPGMRTMTHDSKTGKNIAYDQFFIQIRSAIGSKAEAQEWPKRVKRPATLVSSSKIAQDPDRLPDEYVDPSCKDKLEVTRSDELAFQGKLGWPLQAVTFHGRDDSGPHTLIGSVDRIVCRENGVWILAYPDRRPELRIRHYSDNGKLISFVDTALPPAKLGQREIDLVDKRSLREENGQVLFERVISSLASGKQLEKKRELFKVKL